MVVAAVVLLAGARLLALSMQQRAAGLRVAAQDMVAGHARLIEIEMQKLVTAARAESRRVASVAAANGVPLVSVAPHRNSFWMTDAGLVLRTGDSDPSVSRTLAGDWTRRGADGQVAAELFGPVRYGSQWFVAAQAPIGLPDPHAAATPRALVVSYEDLDALLLRARFGLLVREGYDFELVQRLAPAHDNRLFHSSRGELAGAVSAVIHAPASRAAGANSADLELAIRPRAGWYPARTLATGGGLIGVLAWLLAWGVHDLMRGRTRTQAALANARARLRAVHELLATEIDKHAALQRSLDYVRFHDPSTGLPNRRHFMNRLDRALRDMRTRHLERIAIGLIHIDRFALINDTLGHTAGDELLLHVAKRFEKALAGSESVLARWGTDQLALLVCPLQSAADAPAIVSDLQAACQAPIALRKHRVRIGIRIGFTCVDSGLQRTEEALREADIALSSAMQPKGPPSVAYTPGMGGAAKSLIGLEADLHIALDRREFGLVFQPIVDLRAGRAVGVETLLRWRHPALGVLTPDKFLAIAEEAGVIVPVTHWVIERACRLAAAWRQRLHANADFYVSVNLSAAALADPGLSKRVAAVLAAARIPPRYLKLELTESGLDNNPGAAREALGSLHDMGVELMLDDFGSGNSSLNYLRRFPFDYLKIDRPIVNLTGSERANAAITVAILQMASSLGLRAVAKLVDTQATALALVRMGCSFGQGHFYSAPVAAEVAFERLRSHTYPPMVLPQMPPPEPVPAPASAPAAHPGDPTAATLLQANPAGVAEEGENAISDWADTEQLARL
ncbi:MAG: bifunctional diguanylate cyclase/phosphodiesterase [Gammaproteobacteria bacterium]|nr:bifunctional diguanylate cyclase/phosphodiesterase [Gammaproteobacteria bacterium]